MSNVTPLTTGKPAPNPLLTLLDLGHRARAAETVPELNFLLVNDSRALLPYRQAALWHADSGVHALSGVVRIENNAPYAQWLNRLCKTLNEKHTQIALVDRENLPAEIVAEWGDWLPRYAVWSPLAASNKHPGSTAGGLLLAGESAFSPDHLALLDEWIGTWRHAWLANFRAPPWSRALLRNKFNNWRAAQRNKPWWRRRTLHAIAFILAALCFPVRLTVLAQGELVPANPVLVRAPLDGVIGEFHVRPNENVSAGQLLFSFDVEAIATRLDTARQALVTAQTRYRQFAQLALADDTSKAQLAVLSGEINEKQTTVDYLQDQFERAQVRAPRDGMVLFEDVSEWLGRPVQIGERVLRLATPGDVEIEAWLGIGDAIPLNDGAPVRLYLAANPLDSIDGNVRYLGHDAVPRPDGTYAYRIHASLDDGAGATSARIGLKGTAKIYGERVPLGYWILRRPLATVRQFLAL